MVGRNGSARCEHAPLLMRSTKVSAVVWGAALALLAPLLSTVVVLCCVGSRA